MDDRIGAHRVVALVAEDADPLLVVRWEDERSGLLACLRRIDPRDADRARSLIERMSSKATLPQVPTSLVENAGTVYVVSGFTPHISLRRMLEGCFEKRVRLAPHVSAQIVAKAASGLSSFGVSHGAIDVARVGLSPLGEVLLVGLGAARAPLDDRAMPDTRRIGYSAPEVKRIDEAEERADVFSLGVVLWETLTLRRLFPASTEDDARARMHGTSVPPPTTLARDVPEALEAVVMQALAIDPKNRFPTLAALAGALSAVTKPVQPTLLAKLARTLVEPGPTIPELSEMGKAWRGIEPDASLLETLAAPLPTFFPKSFGDEPMRPKRVAAIPGRTQTLIGVTSPLTQPAAQAASAAGRVPMYKPKATLVGVTVEPRSAPRASYAEASVPTNAPAVPSAPNRRAPEGPMQSNARRADATVKSNRQKSMPPPLPPEATRWSQGAVPAAAPVPSAAPVPVPMAPAASETRPKEPSSGEAGWEDEDTAFYSRQGAEWDDEPKTEVTDLPPVDQLPSSPLPPQRGMGDVPTTSPGSVAAPTTSPEKPPAPAAKAAPSPVKTAPAPVAKAAPSPAVKPGVPAKVPPKPSATTSGITTSATTSGIAKKEPTAPVPTPEVKPVRTPLGAPPPKRAPQAAVPARVVRVGTPADAPKAESTPAPAPSAVAPSASAPQATASAPPAQDPSWSALLESSAGTPVPPEGAAQPAAAAPANAHVAPRPGIVAPPASLSVPPPAQVVLPGGAVRASPEDLTLAEPIVVPRDASASEPPAVPTRKVPRALLAVVALGLAVGAAFLIGRITAPSTPDIPPSRVVAAPLPPPLPAPTPPVVAPTPTPTADVAPPPVALVDAAVATPDAAVAVTPAAPPAAPPPPAPEPEPPRTTTTARAPTMRATVRMAPAAMTTAPAMTAMRPVIRAPDF